MTDARSWRPVELAADAAPPAGAYSAAVRAGDLIFVSGQVPRDPATGRIEGDVAQQTRQVLANLKAVLAGAGATLDDVVSVTAYLADIGDWEAFNKAYSDIFRPPYPTRTTLGAGLHGFLVEINAIAYVGRQS
jgi:2-iminobutanoate/2-iminopropanoate deaminase